MASASSTQAPSHSGQLCAIRTLPNERTPQAMTAVSANSSTRKTIALIGFAYSKPETQAMMSKIPTPVLYSI